MAKSRYDSLIIVQQIYVHVGWQEFTKHDIPQDLRLHLASLSASGYIKRTRKTPDVQHHYIPVYRIVSKYCPREPQTPKPCAHPLSAIDVNTSLTHEPDTV